MEADSGSAADQEVISVRATVHLPGLRLGERALVLPSDPYIAGLLASDWLVPEREGG